MANYSLVVNSKFQPFSYERYMQPILAYDQAYKQLEEQYGAIADKAAVLEKLRDSDIDADSYGEYKDFMNTLEGARDSMYSKGMTGADRARLMQARRDYMSTIQPLQEAFDRREKEALMQYQAEVNNPYIKFSREARNTSLAQYKAGTPDIQVIDGTKLSQMASQMALPYAQTIMSKLSSADLEKILPYQYQQKIQYGLSPQEFIAGLAEAASGNPQGQAAQIISSIQKQVYDTSGLGSWEKGRREELTPWAYSMINSGLNSLIGKTSINDLKDDYNRELDLYQKKAEIDVANTAPSTDTSLMDADYLYNTIGDQDARQEYEEALKNKWIRFDSNGHLYITKEAGDKYRRELAEDTSTQYNGIPQPFITPQNNKVKVEHSPFVKFMKKTGLDKYIDTKGTKDKTGKVSYKSHVYEGGRAYLNYLAANGVPVSGADLRGTAITRRIFDNPSNENIARRLASNMSTELVTKQFKDGKYIPIKDGKAIKKSEIQNNNVRIQDVYWNEGTQQLMARVYRVKEDKKGSGNRVAIDGELYDVEIPTSSSFYAPIVKAGRLLSDATQAYNKAKAAKADERELTLLDKAAKLQRAALYREMGFLGSLTSSVSEKADPNN